MKSTEEQRAEKFYELKQNGMTEEEIASTYFLPASQVRKIIKAYEKGHQLPSVRTLSSSTPRMRAFAEKAEEFYELQLNGATPKDIADRYGVPVSNVYYTIASYKHEHQVSGAREDQRAKEFRELRLQGVTLEDIGQIHGITRERVRQIIDRYEKMHDMPSSGRLGQQVRTHARKADKTEIGIEKKYARQFQGTVLAETIQLDVELVGRFLQALAYRKLSYRYYGKNKKRKDGTPFPNNENPACVEFATQENGSYVRYKLHHWVLKQYSIEVSKGYHCHHIDGDVTNNMRENLQVIPNTEHGRITMQEQKRKGTINYSSIRRRLTIEQVEEIRTLYKPRVMTTDTLAKMYGVGHTTIENALFGEQAYSDINPVTQHIRSKPEQQLKEQKPRIRKQPKERIAHTRGAEKRRKLTNEQVEEARSFYRAGSSISELVGKYGVTHSCIENAIYGKKGYRDINPSTRYVRGETRKQSGIRRYDTERSVIRQHKLTDEQVEEIRTSYRSGKVTFRVLALRYGVSHFVIENALYGTRAYKDINPSTRYIKGNSSAEQIMLDFGPQNP